MGKQFRWNFKLWQWFLLASGLSVSVNASHPVSANGAIRRLTLDAKATVVPLFQGIEDQQFSVRMTANNAHLSQVFIENKTETPLTVALPKAAVGVHVLPQFNGGNFNGGNNGFFQGAGSGFGNTQGGNSGQGTAQSVGGTFQGSGQNLGTGSGPTPNFFGNGFPSIPPEMPQDNFKAYGGMATIPAGKSIQVELKTVCLNYGRPDPQASFRYELVAVERYSDNAVLAELLESYTERVDRDVMQAAAWHIANGLTWDQLANLTQRRIAAGFVKIFTRHEVTQAEELVSTVETAAQQRSKVSSPNAASVATTSTQNR